jgi:hypothetical protein
MALIVEQGITRDLLHGSVVAWRFLASNNVPESVILRVLGEPGQRRVSDTYALQGAASAIDHAEYELNRH